MSKNSKQTETVNELQRYKKDLYHRPTICFSSIHKGVMYYSVIKVFKSLPPYIIKLLNKKQQFKHAVKEYLITHAFYSL